MAEVLSIPTACTGLSYMPEIRLGVRPTGVKWIDVNPTAYPGEFGAVPSFMSDTTLGAGRLPEPGRKTSVDVPAGFTATLRQHWIQPLMPGVFLAKALESGVTDSFNRTTSSATLTGAAADGYTGTNFTAANKFKKTDTPLVVARGFKAGVNNGLKEVSTVAATKLSVAGLSAETTTDATVSVCGVKVDSAKATLTLQNAGARIAIKSAALKKGEVLEPPKGSFLWIGGDALTTRFSGSGATNLGWVRVIDTDASGIICDITAFNKVNGAVPTPVAAASNTNDIQIFMPTRIFRDQQVCNASTRTTYSIERRLGHSDDDLTVTPNEQSELVAGALVNQLEIGMPTDERVSMNFTFIGASSEERDGTPGAANQPWTTGNIAPADLSEFYQTGSDIKQGLIYRYDETKTNKPQLFGLVQSGTLTINNGATGIKGWGVEGAHDINIGPLMINLNVTALFTKIGVLQLSRQGIPAGVFIALARENQGVVLDIPRVLVKSSSVGLSSGQPATVSLQNEANANILGYGMSAQFFNYLPSVATT